VNIPELQVECEKKDEPKLGLSFPPVAVRLFLAAKPRFVRRPDTPGTKIHQGLSSR
jgi:hypothetical protein